MTPSLADRILRVDHAGEHGAVNIYRAQILISRRTAPGLTSTLQAFAQHERRHRALFQDLMLARGIRRCRSYHLCGIGGYALGLVTAFLGASAIAATTFAVEDVVLGHLRQQIAALDDHDPTACDAIRSIFEDEQAHHAHGKEAMRTGRLWPVLLTPVVRASTQAVIWMGMKL